MEGRRGYPRRALCWCCGAVCFSLLCPLLPQLRGCASAGLGEVKVFFSNCLCLRREEEGPREVSCASFFPRSAASLSFCPVFTILPFCSLCVWDLPFFFLFFSWSLVIIFLHRKWIFSVEFRETIVLYFSNNLGVKFWMLGHKHFQFSKRNKRCRSSPSSVGGVWR